MWALACLGRVFVLLFRSTSFAFRRFSKMPYTQKNREKENVLWSCDFNDKTFIILTKILIEQYPRDSDAQKIAFFLHLKAGVL